MPCLRAFSGHADDVLCASFAAPNVLATGSYDGLILVWNLDSGALKGKLATPAVPSAASDEPPPSATSLHPESTPAPSVDQLTFLQPPARAQGGNHAVQLLVSAGGDGRLRCWNVLAMRLLFVLPLTPPIARDPQHRPPRPAAGLGIGRDAITALRWERRLGMLLAGDAAGRVAVWDCSSLVRLLASAAAAPLKDAEVYARLVPLRRWRAHASAVVSIEIVPPSSEFDDAPPSGTERDGDLVRDGDALSELLITASRDSDLRMWRYLAQPNLDPFPSPNPSLGPNLVPNPNPNPYQLPRPAPRHHRRGLRTRRPLRTGQLVACRP